MADVWLYSEIKDSEGWRKSTRRTRAYCRSVNISLILSVRSIVAFTSSTTQFVLPFQL